ncbi:DUF3788 family protein [Enterococcus sp. S52]|nr:DUF3788 family protein [Enterococcus sp. S52]MBK0069177.1 DUF3788 family protein [Enterococcus sp. S53]MBK0139770.1 DUF3788 family protein [Enterococcus sp. S76]MBK0143771.1 DUF3788 family protein [Enterococcus sp. S77]
MEGKEQLFRDRNVKPTEQLIAESLGEGYVIYQRFIETFENEGISLMGWRYYQDGKAWLSKGEYKWTTTRGTNKVKPIFWLSMWEGFFKVSFHFSEKVRTQLLSLPISEETKESIHKAPTNGTKMKFFSVIFDVASDSPLNDIYVLVNFRKSFI